MTIFIHFINLVNFTFFGNYCTICLFTFLFIHFLCYFSTHQTELIATRIPQKQSVSNIIKYHHKKT